MQHSLAGHRMRVWAAQDSTKEVERKYAPEGEGEGLMPCVCIPAEKYVCRACRMKSDSWRKQEQRHRKLDSEVTVVVVLVVVAAAGLVWAAFRLM